MRIPKRPPTPEHIRKNVWSNSDLLVKGMENVEPSPLVDGKYLHWDQLIRRTPPQGITHEAWWGLVKLYRQPLYRFLPLKDAAGLKFKYAEIWPVSEYLHKADLGAGGIIEMPDAIVNHDTRNRYYINSLIEEAITSSQLEGAMTAHKVAKEMIRSGREPQDKSERMILNNFLAMRHIVELKNQPLSPELVLEIHRRVSDGTMDQGSVGRLRRSDENVFVQNIERDEILHVPPPAEELPERLRAMCDFANGEIPEHFLHPIIRSMVLHFWLAFDHPFLDGNGRTARALFYWSMLRNKYWLFEFVSISRILRKAPAQYGKAFLFSETDDNDLTYFLLHHLSVIDRAIEDLHSYLETKSTETRQLEKKLRGLAQLNHRQRALVSHALRHPRHAYTIASHQMSHNIVYQTARADLLDLAKKGILTVAKVGRTQQFCPAQNLEKILRDLPL